MRRDPSAWTLGELDAVLRDNDCRIASIVRLTDGSYSAVGLRGRHEARTTVGASFGDAVRSLVLSLVPELEEP